MGHDDATVEPALIETDWGHWEGRTLAELRQRHGGEMAALEARGLDFRPPGGESPRDVQARLASWLAASLNTTKLSLSYGLPSWGHCSREYQEPLSTIRAG